MDRCVAPIVSTFFTANLGYEDTITMVCHNTARNSEAAVVGVAVVAFPGQPLVYLAVIFGLVLELPMLLLLSRLFLSFKEKSGRVVINN